MQFMKFPTIFSREDYVRELAANSCEVLHAADTGRFAPYCKLYLDMLEMQLTSDALAIIGHDMNLMQALGGELHFISDLAHAGKIAQGLFVAAKSETTPMAAIPVGTYCHVLLEPLKSAEDGGDRLRSRGLDRTLPPSPHTGYLAHHCFHILR